jgi:isopenicillin-N epimerase
MTLPDYSPLAKHWKLDPGIVYLNHGSFGATPTAVLEKQYRLQMETEAEAVRFFIDRLPGLYQISKKALAGFTGTDPNNLVFVQNTTTGVNTVLKSMRGVAGDEWLTTSHAYGACVHAFRHYAAQNKCTVTVAAVDYPVQNEHDIVAGIEKTITAKTTIALIDYITSASAVIFPVKKIVELLQSRGIKVIVDAAHAPGMVDFHIDTLQPDFFIANCHKWICSPKGSAFLYVAPQHQHLVEPLVISHYNDMAEGTAAHWSNQFFWDGTHDFSAYVCVKDALEFMPSLVAGGWQGIKKQNHELVWQAAEKIAGALQVSLPAPKEMIGSICNIPMPDGNPSERKFHSNVSLKNMLYQKYRIEVPVMVFPASPKQWLRISAQLYNSLDQYDYLLDCLKAEGIGAG